MGQRRVTTLAETFLNRDALKGRAKALRAPKKSVYEAITQTYAVNSFAWNPVFVLCWSQPRGFSPKPL